MTRYLIAFAMLGLASLAYIILSFGARFNGADESPHQHAVGEDSEGQSEIHGERQ